MSPLSFPVLSLWFHAALSVTVRLGPKLSCVWVRVLIEVLTQERGPLSPSSVVEVAGLVTPRGTISSATIYQLITISDGLTDARDRQDDRHHAGCRASSFHITFLPAFQDGMPGATFRVTRLFHARRFRVGASSLASAVEVAASAAAADLAVTAV